MDTHGAPSTPAWVESVMWWHVYPLGFVGAEIRPEVAPENRDVEHRLGHLESWLDHVLELGLNGLQLGPVFASETHGYDTVDYFRIDPRLGDDDDFDRLIEAAHRRGIRVLLDGVFNHVGRGHSAFRDLEAKGPDSSFADLFRVDWSSWQQGEPVPAQVFEGHGRLVGLNDDSARVEELVVEVMEHWLARGVDGWRLDAAYAVPPSFWARVLPRVRQRFPDAWFTAEVLHGDAAEFVDRSTADSVTQYELWQGIWHGIADGNFFELAHALERHNALLRTFAPSTFLGNHDTTRIASAVADGRHLPHAMAVLFTVGGVPAVYAGDEYAFQGVKEYREGGDDAVRPAFPARPEDPSALPADARETYELSRELIAIRRRNPWLHRASTDVVELTNSTLVLRTAVDAHSIVVALNLADDEAVVPAAGAARVEAGTAQLEGDRLRLAPHGWAVLNG